jgi:hypothetical protein
MAPCPKHPDVIRLGVAVVATVAAAAGMAAWVQAGSPEASPTKAEVTRARDSVHPVHIRLPDGPPRLDTGRTDATGQPVRVSCATCHDTRPPNGQRHSADGLDDFHLGMRYAHGARTCLSCHNAEDYDSLRLADGTALPYTEVMALCAQCHGPQHRDYRYGAHGGMNGHWDLTRGPRTRNTCTDCHDPHAPAYPQVLPAPGPRDRFLRAADEGEGAHR